MREKRNKILNKIFGLRIERLEKEGMNGEETSQKRDGLELDKRKNGVNGKGERIKIERKKRQNVG